MSTAAACLRRFPARRDPVPRGPRREQRAVVVPAAQGRVRATAQGAAGGAVRRARRRVPASAASRSRADPGQLPVPHLSRRPLLEGQVAVQDEHRGVVPVRATAATPTRAATSTSRPARSSSAVGCGTRSERGSRPGVPSSVGASGCAAASTTLPSLRHSARWAATAEARARRASRRITREPSCSRSRTSRSGVTCRTTRRCRPVCPTSLPMTSPPRCRSSACSDRCQPDERGRHGRRYQGTTLGARGRTVQSARHDLKPNAGRQRPRLPRKDPVR